MPAAFQLLAFGLFNLCWYRATITDTYKVPLGGYYLRRSTFNGTGVQPVRSSHAAPTHLPADSHEAGFKYEHFPQLEIYLDANASKKRVNVLALILVTRKTTAYVRSIV